MSRGSHHTNIRSDNGKLLVNGTISTPDVRFMWRNINFKILAPSWNAINIFSPNQHHKGVNNNTIQSQSYGDKYICIWWNQKNNVRPPSGGTNIKCFPYHNSRTTWLLPVSAHASNMEAQMNTSDYLFIGGWIWIKICWEASHREPYYMHQKRLSSISRLDWVIILCCWFGLGP